MSARYRSKWLDFLTSLLLLLCLLPASVYASQMAQKQAQFLEDWSLALVAFSLCAGAWTARFIPTSVDNQIVGGTWAKLFIGLSSGTFATVGLSQQYPNLTLFDLIFPAYLLAAIGTPVMVYAISIASDAETYSAFTTWVKRRFGMGE